MARAAQTSTVRRRAAAAFVAVATLTGCGGAAPSAEPTASADPTSTQTSPEDHSPTTADSASPSEAASPSSQAAEPEPEPGTRIEVSIADGRVQPSGERVRVRVGEPITILVDSDVPGEMHVHATPEVEWSFEAGRSRHRFELSAPGVVEMELHDPALIVAQLEAR